MAPVPGGTGPSELVVVLASAVACVSGCRLLRMIACCAYVGYLAFAMHSACLPACLHVCMG